MRKNIWFVMGASIMMITLVIVIIQGRVLINLLNQNRQRDIPTITSQPSAVVLPSTAPVPTEISIAGVQRPLISEPRVHAQTPLKPEEETSISVDVASGIETGLTYTWHADGGEIVRGQGNPAITYRTPDEPGTYNVRVVVEWDGQSVQKATSIKVVEEPTPVPPSQLPTDIRVSTTDTPTLSPTDTPAATPTPATTPTKTPTPRATPTAVPTLATLSPDVARQQLAPLDQRMQEFDKWVKQTVPERLEEARCPYLTSAAGKCWVYPIGIGNVTFVEGYTYPGLSLKVDVYVYDFEGDEQPEVQKWDLGRDGQFDVLEYDVDGDDMSDFALADTNANGQFDDAEIYIIYQSTPRPLGQPLAPGALPFPFVPIFPY